MAELVARAFDRFGLLIREGQVPVNILARFYVSPGLGCWYQLSRNLNAVRARRNQTGHMWEWEKQIPDWVSQTRRHGRTQTGIKAATR